MGDGQEQRQRGEKRQPSPRWLCQGHPGLRTWIRAKLLYGTFETPATGKAPTPCSQTWKSRVCGTAGTQVTSPWPWPQAQQLCPQTQGDIQTELSFTRLVAGQEEGQMCVRTSLGLLCPFSQHPGVLGCQCWW